MNMDMFLPTDGEKPLDNIVCDGGYCSIFRKIACVGDSLSSGEFETFDSEGKRKYIDMYEYSWGQFMARAAGCEVLNFSKGGMTAKAYCNNFAKERGFWDKDKACQAYIIAIGVNDLYGQNMEIGSMADVCDEDCNKNADTFAGYYAKIIQKYKEIQPYGKFFLVTMPHDTRKDEWEEKGNAHQKLIYEMAKHFSNTYVIDLREYAPPYDKEFRDKFYLEGHMTPAGYVFTAKMIMSYIDYIIRNNMEDFKKVGFIGTEYQGR
ncbi:MAG: SGNH/GDSL hydrolase family protein [Clostridia bacterium]|nr:SGNH/GDSL hydrolase family protein [Clostridia bacterium]